MEGLPYLSDVGELRPPYGSPSALVRAKQIDRIDPHCRNFIARSPLVVSGSTHPERGVDVSLRGDAPGFVQVLDDRHLAIPDRPGNNRLDGKVPKFAIVVIVTEASLHCAKALKRARLGRRLPPRSQAATDPRPDDRRAGEAPRPHRRAG